MKNSFQTVKTYKDLELALKDLGPMIANRNLLLNGRGFQIFGDQRPREMLGNWLVCAVLNFENKTERYKFSSDPTGGDGLIVNAEMRNGYPTEHVMAYDYSGQVMPTEEAIAKAVARKAARGPSYGDNKLLIVFAENGTGMWWPNRAARKVPPNNFHAVWAFGLNHVDDGCYLYNISHLDLSGGDAPTWIVRMEADFGNWAIYRVQ